MDQGDGRGLATSLFLTSVLQTLLERHWLMSRDTDFRQSHFDDFVALALTRELAPLEYLKAWLESPLTPQQLKALSRVARDLSKATIGESARCDLPTFRAFLRDAVHTMTELCVFEEELDSGRDENFLPPSSYRAFDSFDEILGLRFAADVSMTANPASTERLYVGGGAGVQTSYATIFSALEHLRLRPGGHIIDLGSGFGRVGLIAGLWRADALFTGYEYVGHRVRIASDSAERAGISERVRFFEQDLGDATFQIPLADAYYMYDPFCAATYERVLDQLNEISHRHAVSVVTKADAGEWFSRRQSGGSWAAPERHDSGLLSLFRSRPAP